MSGAEVTTNTTMTHNLLAGTQICRFYLVRQGWALRHLAQLSSLGGLFPVTESGFSDNCSCLQGAGQSELENLEEKDAKKFVGVY